MANKLSRRAYLAAAIGVPTTVGATNVAGTSTGDKTQFQVSPPEAACRMLRYDADNNAVRPNGNGPSEAVAELWRYETGNSLYAQPIVANGTVYVASTDQTVYAVDGASGTKQWEVGTNTELRATPAVIGNLLIIPTQERLLAVSATAGTGEWQTQVVSDARSLTAVQEMNGANKIFVLSDGNNKFFCIDAATGDTIWERDVGQYTGYRVGVTGAPPVGNDQVYTLEYPDTVREAKLNAWGLEDGSGQWSTEIQEGQLRNNITYADGALYLGTEGVGRKIDADTGEQAWTVELADPVSTYPLVANSLVYFATDGELVAVDPNIGTKRWSVSLSGTPTSPVYVDGTLYLGSTDNNVYAFDADTGDQNWNFSIGSSIETPPAVTDNIIYVASTNGTVYALSKTDATPPGPDITGDGNPAQDVDGDGVYEDVNGDGSFTIVDVQALFANLETEAVQQNAELFDFNGDGEVDIADVQALYNKLE